MENDLIRREDVKRLFAILEETAWDGTFNYDNARIMLDAIPSVTPQKPILDKIRAEIQDTGAYEQEVNGKTEFVKGITYCLNIIDKYKAESEVKDGFNN